MMKKEDHKEEKSMVLIETLWNVNKTGKTRLYRKKYVLIETLWNVNSSVLEVVSMLAEGFNRNIVECKYLY